jgi:calcineurin-like phosphoesterase family protein
MKMDDVGAVLSNVPQHAGTNWGPRDGKRNVNSAYGNSVDHAFFTVPAIAGHQHAHVHRFAQSLAKRLDVRLNAAEVRPIELANVQDALFLYVTQGCP